MTGEAADALRRRPEGEADAPFLFALFCAVQGVALAGLDPALRTMLLRQSFAGQRATYRARWPDARFEIVECDGAAIGRTVVDETEAAVTLVDIALLPLCRGQGYGTRLIREICDAAQRGGRPVRLSVDAANHPAQRLYARLGFAPVGATATDIAMRLG